MEKTMQNPKLIPVPFANSGIKDDIPKVKSTSMSDEKASWETGFPEATMLPVYAGGLPPDGKDFNGVLNQISENLVFQSKGGRYKFDPDFALSIGGYPKGATLQTNDESAEYQSLIDNNLVNFNTATPEEIAQAWRITGLGDAIEVLNGKFDKASVKNELGLSQTEVVSQKVVTELGSGIVGSFENGLNFIGELTNSDQQVTLENEFGKQPYYWDGDLPKQVPAGSTPQSTGGIGKGAWVSVGDASLRGNLRSEDGLSFIGETNYEGVRNYTGSNSKIGVYGVSNVFDGGDGTYLLDTSDTTSSDDGGIVIIDSLNRRWKRQYLGKVKAEWFGAKADGVTDSTIAIQNAINNQMNSPVEMSRGEYCISDTIMVKEFKSLEGVNDTIEAWSEKSSGTVIKWIGGTEPRKSMVLLGNNEVGAEPTIGSPAVCFRNVFLNGNYKVGFLAYGTYLSRDSIIDNIGGEGSTDYNFYFAKSWYATYTRIVSKNCKNNGIAFGMPLVYSDGEKVIWTSPAPLEMNRCKIDNIRSHSSGQRYSVDNPNTYNPKNDAMRMTGYGIGAGIGNSFSLTNFLSEQSGGVNLYYYTETQPVKVVDGGYLELSCLNSGLDPATELPNIIIDVSVGASNGGGQVLSNVFSNYGSGGIYTVRNGQVAKPIELINIHQPRFLKDIGNDNTIDSLNYPLKFVKLINTYYQLGYYNLLGASVSWLQFNINIRNGWSYAIPCSDTRDFFRVMFRNNAATWNPSGSITFTRPDGSTFSSSYPSTAAQGEWIDIRIIDNVEKISRSGSAGSVDQNIDIKIIRLPSSQL